MLGADYKYEINYTSFSSVPKPILINLAKEIEKEFGLRTGTFYTAGISTIVVTETGTKKKSTGPSGKLQNHINTLRKVLVSQGLVHFPSKEIPQEAELSVESHSKSIFNLIDKY